MNKKLVVGNWKMNSLRGQARQLSSSIVDLLGKDYNVCQVVLSPPYTAFDAVRDCLAGSKIDLGAQNVFGKSSGAFTGEISPQMLVDAGCRWVILGHSERRHILGETNEQINEKLLLSISCGLKAILCVGETKTQRETAVKEGGNASERRKRLFTPIKIQIETALRSLDMEQASNLVVAYEPVWAIGTGENATSVEIAEIHRYIRELLVERFSESGSNIEIIYGGSVSVGNIKDIMSVKEVNGVLVGGASLSADSFFRIIKSVGG